MFGRVYNKLLRIKAERYLKNQPSLQSEIIIDNPKANIDETAYVIRRNPSAGFFSNYFYVMGHIIEATKRNLIPIVDFQNYLTPYSELFQVHGTSNSWEYYFEQPFGYKVSDIKSFKRCIYSANIYQFGKVPTYWGGE